MCIHPLVKISYGWTGWLVAPMREVLNHKCVDETILGAVLTAPQLCGWDQYYFVNIKLACN